MKKSKFLILGSVASLSAIPFVAAKCDDTDSSPTINNEDGKNNKDDTKNNPEVNNNTNTDSGNKNGEQSGNSTSSENSQANPGGGEESNNSETTPNSDGGNSSESGESNRPGEKDTPMNDEAVPSETPTDTEMSRVPETTEGSRMPESTTPSDQEGHGTPGSETEGTTPGNGEGRNRGDEPMADNSTENSSAKEKIKSLHTTFEKIKDINEKVKTVDSTRMLNNELHSASEIIKYLTQEEKTFFGNIGLDDSFLDELGDFLDMPSQLITSDETLQKEKTKFIEKFKEIKSKIEKAFEASNKPK
ncbi:variable surface lipoprotein [Mycoplasmopsis agalactiae]|nr:variable surface lipoprotein [Mycoplasmopsis agalactiae]MCE6091101.1 variable surface lipoprotein [Mycoplasmopsis agalactiae]